MVYMFLADGFEEIEALCPLDLLRRAGVDVKTVGVGSDVICGAHGIKVFSDMRDSDFNDDRPEMIILPGGMPGTTHLDKSAVVEKTLSAVYENGGFLAAICAAPRVLGKRGYLKNKKAICYPGFETYLTGASLSDSRVCRDGKIITAAGAGVALEFALALIGVLYGEEKAGQIRASVLAD